MTTSGFQQFTKIPNYINQKFQEIWSWLFSGTADIKVRSISTDEKEALKLDLLAGTLDASGSVAIVHGHSTIKGAMVNISDGTSNWITDNFLGSNGGFAYKFDTTNVTIEYEAEYNNQAYNLLIIYT